MMEPKMLDNASEKRAERVESLVNTGQLEQARQESPSGGGASGLKTQLKSLGFGAGAAAISPASDPAEQVAHQGTSGSGQDVPHQAVAEQALGVSMAGVRAHFGPQAKAACDALGAEAFAYGRNVAFKDPSPSPGLVAHELTHVVQQHGEQETKIQRKTSGSSATTYTVKKGDTLSGIAAKFYGDANAWQKIAAANGLKNPNALQIGQVLVIPNVSSSTQPKPPAENTDSKPPASPATYTVKKGDTLSGIAAKLLGDSSKWPTIAQANGIKDPSKLQVGQVLKIPGAAEQSPPAASKPPAEQPKPPAETTPSQTTYTVKSGDTLSGIAGKFYGDSSKWTVIAQANGIKDPTKLKVGQVLQIPGAGAATQPSGPAPAPAPAPSPGNTSGDKNLDPAMQPDDPIPLTGLSGLNYSMAVIYNTKGKYLKTMANQLGVDAASCAAVLQIEAGGKGFSNNKMIVRFENHIFWGQWGKNNPNTFNQHFKFDSGKTWQGHYFRANPNGAWESFHGNQTSEWKVLDFARTLNDTGALKSISMGAAQIMGFNHAAVGYNSVQDMFNTMNGSLKPQLDGMFAFIQGKKTCIDGLKEKDYVKFASGYNGTGQATAYGANIEAAAIAFKNVAAGKKYA